MRHFVPGQRLRVKFANIGFIATGDIAPIAIGKWPRHTSTVVDGRYSRPVHCRTMIKDHPNPYIQASLHELSAALHRCADQLQTANGTVERQDVAHLLLAVAKRLAPKDKRLGEPANRVRAGADVLTEFWPRYELEKRAIRWHLFHQAAEAAGLTPADFGAYFTLTGRPLTDRVLESEDGYREALDWIEEARRAGDWASRQVE